MSKSTFGNQLKVVGSNYNVGKMSGINCTKTIMIAFMCSSICASIAGIFLTSLNQVGAFYVGQGYDFMSVTAIILGGMSLAGGRGTMVVFLEVITLGLISNLLTFCLKYRTFTRVILTGVIFIIVVACKCQIIKKVGSEIMLNNKILKLDKTTII